MELNTEYIKDLMDKAAIDINKLATLMPCTPQALYTAFKKKQTKTKTADRIAAIFGVNPKDLWV